MLFFPGVLGQIQSGIDSASKEFYRTHTDDSGFNRSARMACRNLARSSRTTERVKAVKAPASLPTDGWMDG